MTPSLDVRLGNVLRKMSMLQDGGVSRYDKSSVSSGSGGHHSHSGSAAPTFLGGVPLCVEWHERFERLIIAAERDLAEYIKGVEPSPAVEGHRISSGLLARIRNYEGRDIAWVAFVERCSARTIERARARLGLDTRYGLPKDKPLTSREINVPQN